MHSTRLAEILRHQATLLEHIITDQRYYPDYFRVTFFGEFPDAIRGKQFIVRLCTTHHSCFADQLALSSIEATSGKSMEHSVNECSTNTQDPSC